MFVFFADHPRRRRLLMEPEDHVAFTATHSTNASAFGAYATIIFDTVESNVGRGYDTKTGVFTCPFNGYYFFTHLALSPYNGHIETDISRIVRKPDFCLCENKGADQLRSNCEADQHLCCRYSESTIPLLIKSKISIV